MSDLFPLSPRDLDAYRKIARKEPCPPNPFWPREDWEWWVRSRGPVYERDAKRCRKFAEVLPWRCAQDRRDRGSGILTVRN